MIPRQWLARLFGRVPLDSHIQQIVSGCREAVWQEIEGRVNGLSRGTLTGYVRVRAAHRIRRAVRDHLAKFGMQSLESELLSAALEKIVPEMLQRAAVSRSSQSMLRAA
jgi:hypothetical protein